MNAKTCKRLRKMASMMYSELRAANMDVPYRKLMVHPAHEKRARAGDAVHITAVNHAQSWRGIYRWLKRHHHEAV